MFCNLSATCEPRVAQSGDLEECILIACNVVDGEEEWLKGDAEIQDFLQLSSR